MLALTPGCIPEVAFHLEEGYVEDEGSTVRRRRKTLRKFAPIIEEVEPAIEQVDPTGLVLKGGKTRRICSERCEAQITNLVFSAWLVLTVISTAFCLYVTHATYSCNGQFQQLKYKSGDKAHIEWKNAPLSVLALLAAFACILSLFIILIVWSNKCAGMRPSCCGMTLITWGAIVFVSMQIILLLSLNENVNKWNDWVTCSGKSYSETQKTRNDIDSFLVASLWASTVSILVGAPAVASLLREK
mmetsp:Transcript_12992/g.18162  ORF Transcript_12992/g.18162 Transcript_12992/m.18162 type:complete len:244 (-) Transcript_12992:88-819(-)|eukprot:jgi/Bigna1/88695/estExt_fgenesh1_pg.C_360117